MISVNTTLHEYYMIQKLNQKEIKKIKDNEVVLWNSYTHCNQLINIFFTSMKIKNKKEEKISNKKGD